MDNKWLMTAHLHEVEKLGTRLSLESHELGTREPAALKDLSEGVFGHRQTYIVTFYL